MLHQFFLPSGFEDRFEEFLTFRETPTLGDDDTHPHPHRVSNGLPPISVEIPTATSPMNTREPPSSSSITTPHNPSLVSPSQAAHASCPDQLTVTPASPAHSLDVHPPLTHSAPVSLFLTQHPLLDISHPVRVLSILSAFVPITSPRS